jgi:hypothetical protein
MRPDAAVPDRLIVEVGTDGMAHPTGVIAPPEPSRAIAPLSHAHPPAVEAPLPSLSVPQDEPKRTKPSRRRRTTRRGVAGELENAGTVVALPSPQAKPARTRKRAATAQAPSKAAAETQPAPAKSSSASGADGKVKKAPRKRKTAATTPDTN